MSRTPFVHVEHLPEDGEVVLAQDRLHHLRRVLRLDDGAAIVVSDGRGRRADARLAGDGATIAGAVVVEPRVRPELVLAQAIPKRRGFDEAVRFAVEAGVDRVVPLLTARGQVRPDAAGGRSLVERALAVAEAAAGQAVRAWVPTVEGPVDLGGLLGSTDADDLVLVGVPGGPGPLAAVPGPGAALGRVIVVVGPEGGLTDDELDLLEVSGARRLGLGSTVLRSEHAGGTLAAVVAARLGRLEVGATPGPVSPDRSAG